ncbi:MAG: hypothetical protein M3082_11210 [Candidatus Dormibacteraeota bacterium]|nr:hypothetical protein [Candidatus Dormibacteraeota bacterium]
MKVLILLTFPEPIGKVYRDGLAEAFPHLQIDMVDHHSKVDPYIRESTILVTFGAHMADHVLEKAISLKWIQALGTGVDGIVDRPAFATASDEALPIVIENIRHFLAGDVDGMVNVVRR